MSIETTRETMQGYIDALVRRGPFASFFADDVVFVVEGGQTITGRAAVEQFIVWLHTEAFDARPEIKAVYSADGHAALEAEFVGRHTGEFFGVPASQNEVRVPYAVIYDLRGTKITALRFYMPMNLLMEQITAAAPALTAA